VESGYDGDAQAVAEVWETEVQMGEGERHMRYVNLFILQRAFYQPLCARKRDQIMIPQVEGPQPRTSTQFRLHVAGPEVEKDYFRTTGFQSLPELVGVRYQAVAALPGPVAKPGDLHMT